MIKKCKCCHKPAIERGYCADHLIHRKKRIYEEHSAYKTARWKRLSKSIRNEYPICQCCNKRVSDVVDHCYEIAWFEGEYLTYNEANLIAVCHSCHNEKTARVRGTIKDGKPTKKTVEYLVDFYRLARTPAQIEYLFFNRVQD